MEVEKLQETIHLGLSSLGINLDSIDHQTVPNLSQDQGLPVGENGP